MKTPPEDLYKLITTIGDSPRFFALSSRGSARTRARPHCRAPFLTRLDRIGGLVSRRQVHAQADLVLGQDFLTAGFHGLQTSFDMIYGYAAVELSVGIQSRLQDFGQLVGVYAVWE